MIIHVELISNPMNIPDDPPNNNINVNFEVKRIH